MNIGDQFTATFADTIANLDQDSQLLHQQICGAKHKCTLPGLPLDGATIDVKIVATKFTALVVMNTMKITG